MSDADSILAGLTWIPNVVPPGLPRAERLRRVRHSSSHIMAQAVREIFPDVKLAIGPPIENGFYYDMDLPRALTPGDLPEIEKRMRKIAARNPVFERAQLPRLRAIELFRAWKQDYKLEILAGIADDTVSLYRQDRFIDLCAGPHVAQGGACTHFKLTSIAGAYWRGDERRPMLQRIYGTAWESAEDLEEYLRFLEDSKMRDHRKLGQQLDLFSFHPWSAGCPFWHPRGVVVRNELLRLWRETHAEAGYLEILNPVLYRKDLFVTSGHWDHFRENMFLVEDGAAADAAAQPDAAESGPELALKPMNCPDTMLYYKTRQHSYRDLPLRIGEGQLLHRAEPMGALHGLMRARVFTQDDAHLFVREEQIQDEIGRVLALLAKIYAIFGLRYSMTLSTKPEKAMGAPELWEKAEHGLRQALEAAGHAYKVDAGGGAYYGPKIDVKIHDSMGREWQCGTVQLDFQLPRRFELEYIDADNQPRTPVVIHRALFGSIERFLGILLEHFAGALPTWLAPVQALVMPIAEGQTEYAEQLVRQARALGLRVELAPATSKINYRIREAEMNKVPYMLVVGKREAAEGSVSLRTHQEKDRGVLPAQTVWAEIAEKVRNRVLDVAVKDYSSLFAAEEAAPAASY
ncbi:MAG TPA: threonine--tRNA ligase [Terriglobales bacterium]|nr:threonine--tRNA ligase [Terriglobales bacterium]